MEVEVGICGCACGAPRNFWNFFEFQVASIISRYHTTILE